MTICALVHQGQVIDLLDHQPSEAYPSTIEVVQIPAGAMSPAIGDSYAAGQFGPPTPPPATAAPRYVPLSTIRERVTAAGKWLPFCTALDSLPADQRWHLLTLAQGVASDDPAAVDLLTAIGCDPTQVLA